MPVEIERKFLVHPDRWQPQDAQSHKMIRQGYLLSQPDKSIRIRTDGEQGFITIKGQAQGRRRLEYEYVIPINEAQEMLEHFAGNLIEKIRYEVYYAGKLWEVDQFEGANEGLLMAEVELDHDDEVFEMPAWLGEEVTYDARYLNVNLAQKPYRRWQ